MNVLSERERSNPAEATQEDETLPECLRFHQPFVMLWSEKQPRPVNQEINWQFSDNYQGVTDVNYAMHDVVVASHDSDGRVVADCNFSF